MDDKNNVAELVRRNETDYRTGSTTISEYVDFSLSDNINKIEAYLNSKHTSGSTDSLGRDKPFFNIVTAATNVWFRATDIDRRHITIKPTRVRDTVAAFLANVHLHDWMRKDSFGITLNDWGRTLARYGSAVLKFIESDGQLHSSVVPWNRLIVDPVAFDNDVVIEVLELTPAQLRRRKGYDQDMVKELIQSTSARETLGGQTKDNKDGFIKVYEVHGEMPLSWITGKEKDNDTYTQQMHVVSFVANDKKKGTFDDYTLYKGKEKKNPYYITHLIKEDGRTQAIGAVEHLFESQWMMNHTAKSIKDQLDLASKLIFQTSDGNFVGQNALSAIESGDILVHSVGAPLTQVNNNSHDITSLQNFASQWKSLGNEITGVSEAMLGVTPKSGTAWRQTEAVLQESHSLFELMTENKGLALEEMMRMYVIPFIKTKLNSTDEVAMTLGDMDISQIETKYIKNEAIRRSNKKIKETILSGVMADPADIANEEKKVAGELVDMGTQRFFKPSEIDGVTWKDSLQGLEWEVTVDVTGEAENTEAMMTTLTTVFRTLASRGGAPMSPDERLVFNKILTAAGSLSPIELSVQQEQQTAANATAAAQQTQPTAATLDGEVGALAGLQI